VITNSLVFIPPTCPNQSLGLSCNISSDPCSMMQPCLNLATCYQNTSVPLGYICLCVAGFSGVNCEVDNRFCTSDSTCLYGGSCNETLNDTGCTCPTGKIGNYCEYQVDLCANISCQNDAVCISAYGNWSCLCTNTDLYSGVYCETKASSLVIKEIISRSFGCVAIGCIVTVVSFVILLDTLKYVFNIDPVQRDFRLIREKHRREERKRREERRKRMKMNKSKQPVVAVRFHYVHG